jgi:hypothetical protein
MLHSDPSLSKQLTCSSQAVNVDVGTTLTLSLRIVTTKNPA